MCALTDVEAARFPGFKKRIEKWFKELRQEEEERALLQAKIDDLIKQIDNWKPASQQSQMTKVHERSQHQQQQSEKSRRSVMRKTHTKPKRQPSQLALVLEPCPKRRHP